MMVFLGEMNKKRLIRLELVSVVRVIMSLGMWTFYHSSADRKKQADSGVFMRMALSSFCSVQTCGGRCSDL